MPRNPFPPPPPLYPVNYGPAPIPLRHEPHIPLTAKTGMRREEIEQRLAGSSVTPEDKAAWNAKYDKPLTGIPKTDLSSGVQASLDKADTALQEHQDITGKVDKTDLFDNPTTDPKVKSALLPSYVDDVLEYASLSAFPSSGETGKIYVAKDTNKIYRWGGSEYVQVGGGELPTLATVATTGDYGDLLNKPTIPSVPSAATATPLMDGTAAVGSGTKWAKEDHVHPTDTSRAAADSVVALSGNQTIYGDKTFSGQVRAADIVSDYSYGFSGSNGYITAPENAGAALTAADIQDDNSALGSVLAAKADSSGLATVATTGSYSDLSGLPTIPAAQVNSDWNATSGVAQILNKPSIPAAQVNADWNAASGVAQILNKPTIPSTDGPFTAREEAVASQTREQTSYGKGGAATSDGEGNTWSTALPKNNGTLALQDSIAPAFSSSSTYAVGDYVTHEGLLYKCTTAVLTAGAWNAANWSAVAVTDEMGADTPLPFDAECEYVASPADGGCGISPPYYCYISGSCDCTIELYIPAGSNSSDCFSIGAWKSSNCCCIFANSGTATQFRYDSSNVVNGTYATDTWQTLGFVGTTVYCGSSTGSFTRSIFSDTTAVFGVGFGKNIRIRRIRLTYGGTDIFDARPVRVGQIGAMYDVVRGKIFYSSNTNNLVPGPDKAQPTITTPGRIVELTPAIRYAFAAPTPSVSGTSATVACEDRAINDFTVATGITSLTITPPAAVTGRARDFFCRVTLTDSSLPTVTLSGGTIDIGSTEVAGMTQGVNLLMFTEISSGHWLASRRSAS